MNTQNRVNVYTRGSEWRRWDLHVHTPASYAWESVKDDNACKQIINRMNESDISVFAITDYWTFDGFKKLMEIDAALPKDEKLKKVVLPGIELRFDILTDEADPNDKTRVNFQVIFNNDDGNGLYRINQFYSKLKLSSTEKVISEYSFIEIAKEYPDDVLQKLVGKKRSQCKDEDYLIAGYKSCYISYDCLSDMLKKDQGLGENLFIVVPWDKYGGISGIDPLLRDDIKKKLTKLSHALESARDETIKLFLLDESLLSSKSWAESWRQFLDNSAKPCICGSDAKKIESIGVFPNNRVCWVKADTTFEGLKQTTYEPRDRVYVGTDNPSAFRHVVIDSFKVVDTNESFFLKEVGSIPLNAGLNCVIGPRGSGKSTLLDAIAFSLGAQNVLDEDRNNYVGFFFRRIKEEDLILSQVKSSSSGDMKDLSPLKARCSGFLFDYYHQKQIGYLADPNNEERLSRFLFEKIFKGDAITESLFSELLGQRESYISQLAINREEIVACEKEIVKEREIRAKITDKNNRVKFLSQDSIQHLLDERSKIIKLNEKVKRIRSRIQNLEDEPLITGKELVEVEFFQEIRLSSLDPEGTVIPTSWKRLEDNVDNFLQSLGDNKEVLENKVKEITEEISKIEPSLNLESKLNEIWEQIQTESAKHGFSVTQDELGKLDSIQKEILTLEEQLKTIEGHKNKKQSFLGERKRLLGNYNNYLASVKEKLENSFKELLYDDGAILNDTIKLEIRTMFLFDDYLEVIKSKAVPEGEEDQIPPRFPNKKALSELFKSLGRDKIVNNLRESIFDDWNTVGLGDAALEYFNKIKNKEEVAMHLEELLPELTSYLLWRPEATRDFKLLRNCSIGERGTALLSVILVASHEPLIIDQPEDDLDHFYLYKTLTPIIKEVKKRRQLIFATHDANIVVNGDAELILIVNTSDGQFGRVASATIENLDTREKVLDILEGGKDAFETREKKYGFK